MVFETTLQGECTFMLRFKSFVISFCILLFSASMAFSATDNFQGVFYGSTHEQYNMINLGQNMWYKYKGSPSYFEEEMFCGLPMGTMHYSFNPYTKLFSAAGGSVDFRYGISAPYYEYAGRIKQVVAPMSDKTEYEKRFIDFFTRDYGIPRVETENPNRVIYVWERYPILILMDVYKDRIHFNLYDKDNYR
ncbi:hypothetical protein [Cloacibacillus evryensis]|uniref:hypothetical protein n=1 Tax=Cloacibacillus evryensis TaxID=508460 RepID=UPI0011CB0ACA|nr:hypothetical protein [Cloacibacillus evryensis]